jgi:hypothetical protein
MEQAPIQLPEIDTNPEHQVDDEDLNPNEQNNACYRTPFLGGLVCLQETIESWQHPASTEYEHFIQEAFRIHSSLWELIRNNQEGIVVICPDLPIRQYQEALFRHYVVNQMTLRVFGKTVQVFTDGNFSIAISSTNMGWDFIYKKTKKD